jgi:OOP family OmpA-OmpF porin
MKITKTLLYALIIILAIAAFPACKAKKLAVTPQPVAPASVTTVAPPPPTPAPEKQVPLPPPAPPKPDYNFSNIQFEFNSGILKTDSYPALDKAADAMKMDTTARFVLNGNASAEGTADHNMTLSIQRANSVKLYLVNTGVPARMLAIKGFGESNPIADNTTEEGRILNRRVEIKKQ